MELTKQNERYTFADSLENGWNVNGSVNNEINGSLTISASIYEGEGLIIGSFNYYKPSNGNVSVSYDVAETNRDTLTEYINSAVLYILGQF